MRAGDAAVGRLPGCAGICRWRSGCWPVSSGIIRPGPARQLAADLAAARDRLDLMQAENVSVAAAFGPVLHRPDRQVPRRLFRRPRPGPRARASTPTPPPRSTSADPGTARRGPRCSCRTSTCSAEPAPGRYRLHDLLREHARVLAATDNPAEQKRLPGICDYTCTPHCVAGREYGPGSSATRRPPLGRPRPTPPTSTAGQAGNLAETERVTCTRLRSTPLRTETPACRAIPAAIGGFLRRRGLMGFSRGPPPDGLGRRPARQVTGAARPIPWAELGILRRRSPGTLPGWNRHQRPGR